MIPDNGDGVSTKGIDMCHRTTCKTCGKATWSGCGQHIESALKGVPKDQRCTCAPAEKATGSFLGRLFGR